MCQSGGREPYLDNVRVLGVQETHQGGENLGPAHDGVSGEDGGDDGSQSVADIGIRIADMAKSKGLHIVQDIISDIAGVVLNVGLEQESSNGAGCGDLLGHLSQDIDEVVVVVGDMSERLELLLIQYEVKRC